MLCKCKNIFISLLFIYREICCILFNIIEEKSDSLTINEVEFVESMLKLQLPHQNEGIILSNNILPQEFVELFHFFDTNKNNNININNLLILLNLQDSNQIPMLLFEKLRERAREMESQNIPLISLFQNMDRWGADGIIGRQDFKNILKQVKYIFSVN